MGSHREVLLLYFSVVLLGSGHCQFTDEEMEQLLDGHNNIRATVQPVAANMERMVNSVKSASRVPLGEQTSC